MMVGEKKALLATIQAEREREERERERARPVYCSLQTMLCFQ